MFLSFQPQWLTWFQSCPSLYLYSFLLWKFYKMSSKRAAASPPPGSVWLSASYATLDWSRFPRPRCHIKRASLCFLVKADAQCSSFTSETNKKPWSLISDALSYRSAGWQHLLKALVTNCMKGSSVVVGRGINFCALCDLYGKTYNTTLHN